MIAPKIVHEIDKTLDQLIQNAEAMSNADLESLSSTEVDAFQKTQESLLHHLLSLDQQMTKEPIMSDARTACARVRAKRMQFQALESECGVILSEHKECNSILSKRRNKRFFDPRFKKRFALLKKKS